MLLPCHRTDRGDGVDKVRGHGFEWAFHPLQVLGWVIFGIDVLVYAFCTLPVVGASGVLVLLLCCFVVSAVVVVVAAARATGCNPAAVKSTDDKLNNEQLDDVTPFCSICEVPARERCKHCSECNKCVEGFDHHCLWLNNCIGSANYTFFFVAISAVAAMTTVLLTTFLYLLVEYYSEERRLLDTPSFRTIPEGLFLGFLFFAVIINTPLFLLDVQLILLHLFLMSQHMTTYEYILSKQKENVEDVEENEINFLDRFRKSAMSQLDWIVMTRCGKGRRKKRDEKNEETCGPEVAIAEDDAAEPNVAEADIKEDEKTTALDPPIQHNDVIIELEESKDDVSSSNGAPITDPQHDPQLDCVPRGGRRPSVDLPNMALQRPVKPTLDSTRGLGCGCALARLLV